MSATLCMQAEIQPPNPLVLVWVAALLGVLATAMS